MISFAGQVSQLNAQITGSDFFNIGKQLLPTVSINLKYLALISLYSCIYIDGINSFCCV